jgi:thymidylate synthase
MRARAARVHRRISGEAETYFDRLVAYPGVDGQPVNQLEEQVRRLQGQIGVKGPKSSAYEIGICDPTDLRIYIPGKDHKYMGFPCLSHISLTLHGGAVHLTALYRNQGFVRKAYGNYVGLARIGRFFATEVGVRLGEIMCVATHADAELDVAGATRLRELVQRCRSVAGSAPIREVDRAA